MNQLLQKVKRSSPKKGRRAASDSNHVEPGASSSSDAALDSPFKRLSLSGDSSQVAPPKPPRRNTTGWADTSTNFHKGDDPDQVAFKKSNVYEDDEKDNVGSIPDLDDFQEEDFVSQVAKAPNVSVTRVATYKELDNDLHRHSAFTSLNDIDLKALTRFISLETDVKEDDSAWTWDTLIADVTSKLNVEQSLEDETN